MKRLLNSIMPIPHLINFLKNKFYDQSYKKEVQEKVKKPIY